jgi:hypothetical protein
VEFPSQDTDRAQKFWEGVGGWSIQDSGILFQSDESVARASGA